MMIRVTSYVAVFLAAIWLVGFPPALRANVNLEWRPAEQTVLKGDTVEISLYAVSDDPIADQPFSIIEAILLWEPSHLELLGKEDNGPYDWLASSFPDDSGSAFDGLNYPFTGLPSNDGNAWYNAWAWFGSPATATPDGLLVTTFLFEARNRGTTELELPPEFGENTYTRVHDPENPGEFVTGTLGAPAVVVIETVIPTVSEWAMIGMALLMLAVGALVFAGRDRQLGTETHHDRT